MPPARGASATSASPRSGDGTCSARRGWVTTLKRRWRIASTNPTTCPTSSSPTAAACRPAPGSTRAPPSRPWHCAAPIASGSAGTTGTPQGEVSERSQGSDPEHSYVGRPIRRREDLPLVTGQGRYAADVHFSDLLHTAFCRSTVPHGVLRSVDLEAARAMPGGVAAFAAAALPELNGATADAAFPQMHLVGRPILARPRVRYVGEPVALVVAETAYQAVDAAAAVVIDTAALDAASDVTSAARPDAPVLHPPDEGNVAGRLVREFGDVDAAFAGAPVVVRNRCGTARGSGGYLEPRASRAAWDPRRPRSGVW